MPDNIELSLTPADNVRLANLCGAMDENIDHIARALSVKIKRRGGRFRVSGDGAETAAETLRTLYLNADKELAGNDIRMQLAQTLGSGSNGNGPVPARLPAEWPAETSSGFQVRNAAQRAYWDKINRHSVTFCSGPAGSGKTHIAVAAALQLLRRNGSAEGVRRLVLSRPVVEAGGERLGFLPGDMEQKVNPYLRPLYDVLYQLLGRAQAERRLSGGDVEIIPLAFMRGLTLNNAVLILDEAQNTTPGQMKMLLTRLGQNSKMIINGDVSQTDLPPAVTCGLSDAMSRLRSLGDIALHHFTAEDIVRHPLVGDILKAYERS